MTDQKPERMDILVRLLITVVCFIAFELVRLLAQATTLFQYAYLLIARKHSEPVRAFCNQLSTYAYRVLRYATLNENDRPFPFAEFPSRKTCERAAQNVAFDKHA